MQLPDAGAPTQPSGDGDGGAPASGTIGQVEDSQPVPVVAADPDSSPFEIDEVEALPDDADGVLDLHEGASAFVPVTSTEHLPGGSSHHGRRAAGDHG